MIITILLICAWVAFTAFIVWAIVKICGMSPVPLFDAIGMCSGWVLAFCLWLLATCCLGIYLFG